jgi:hypothetical protein
LSLKIIDNKSRENIYSFSVQFNIDDSEEEPDNDSDNNVIDKSLFNSCFKSGKAENYSKCLELFFNNVSFSNEEGDVATVVNDSGNFLVNLPKASINETAIENFFSGLADDSALLTKIIGPTGAQGERGLQGPAGDSIWSIENTNKVTNNGPLGNQATQDLVFGDSTIEGNNQTKLAFEKSTGALRIGSVDADQWLERGNNSVVVGHNSSATKNGSIAIGHENQNDKENAFIFGAKNIISIAEKLQSENSPLASINSNFTIGQSNEVLNEGNRVFGEDNRVSQDMYSDIFGSKNNISKYGNISNSISNFFVVGKNNLINSFSKRRSTIIGSSNRLNGLTDESLILGDRNRIGCTDENGNKFRCGNKNILIGTQNKAGGFDNLTQITSSASRSIAIGHSNKVSSSGAVAMGRFTIASAHGSVVIGSGHDSLRPLRNTKRNTLGIGVSALNPAITVTSPVGFDLRTATGNVGIGSITEPARKLHISDAMRIEPQDHAPQSPSLGDIYVDSSEAVCVFASGAWNKIAGAGECSESLGITFYGPTLRDFTDSFVTTSPELIIAFSSDHGSIEKGSGNITIYKSSDNSVVEVIDVNSSRANFDTVFSSFRLLINPSTTLDFDTEYYVEVDEGIVQATSNSRLSPAITGESNWKFKTHDGVFSSHPGKPEHLSEDVSIRPEVDIVFSTGNLEKQSGNIIIRKFDDDSVVESIDINSSQVTQGLASNVLLIDLVNDLEYGTQYYVDVDQGIVRETSTGEFSTAIDGKTQWRFTTQSSD